MGFEEERVNAQAACEAIEASSYAHENHLEERHMTLSRSSLFLLVPAVALACSSTSEPSPAKALELTPAESRTLGAANEFAFSLFRRLAVSQKGVNVFVSPFSVSASLGMTINGASGATLDAMRTTLGVGTADLAEINAAYKGLVDKLRSADATTTFQSANSIWYRNTFTVKQSFLDTTKKWFDARVQSLNFDDQAASLATINGWVGSATNGKIPSILDEIRPDELMFLINAIYFKGTWQLRFDPAGTAPGSFHAADGTTQTVPMMHRPEHLKPLFGVGGVGRLAIAEVPYGNGAFAMDILTGLFGDDVDVDSIAASLTSSTWSALLASLRERDDALVMPRFSLTYDRTLNDELTALGMGIAFSDAADFSGIAPGLMLEFVKQKAFVDVNEEGTEAGASTVTGVVPVSLSEFRVDHPFIFVIRERSTGAILFMGKVLRIP